MSGLDDPVIRGFLDRITNLERINYAKYNTTDTEATIEKIKKRQEVAEKGDEPLKRYKVIQIQFNPDRKVYEMQEGQLTFEVPASAIYAGMAWWPFPTVGALETPMHEAVYRFLVEVKEAQP